ncbi:serine/threonine-protein kinase [Kribbella pratensis]|uniref:serine/threonine-protein kinase n=1 Tax=Kribbella pratensis TaxID=2512112 RepID=UPI001EE0FF59|nr:serine/threonine-protein kinase [Kribbella pratensis]
MEAFAGRYQLIDLVGTGGMGSVWRAWDLRRAAYVAAKVLGQHDAATLLRFVREQSLRIEHPHVVAPHGWAADDDKVVFAMELVRGGSVATLLGDHGPLPQSYVAVLVDQLLHGLSAVHAARVVHRDVKPANLLLDATGTGLPRLRLSDFGVAGLLDEPRMTRHSTILGTPGYLAPEQVAGADPDPRQDLYAVGAVTAELLTGERPGTAGQLPDLDGALGEFVRRLTAKNPSERPDSAASAGRLLAATGAVPPPGTEPWARDPDAPEVFDQLPPLPPNWTSSGSRTHQPPPTPSTSNWTPGSPRAHQPSPTPSALSWTPDSSRAHQTSPTPSTSNAGSGQAAAQAATRGVAAPLVGEASTSQPPADEPPLHPSGAPAAGTRLRSSGAAAAGTPLRSSGAAAAGTPLGWSGAAASGMPVGSSGAAAARAPASSPAAGMPASVGEVASGSSERVVAAGVPARVNAVASAPAGARVLRVVAVGCFVGAVALLGSAAWLLFR